MHIREYGPTMNYDVLKSFDPELHKSVLSEFNRQSSNISLIASENIASRAVLEAQNTFLTNKYAEGYPGRRYYSGCEFVDEVENICIERVKKIFKCDYANVQPHSGAQANMAVFFALLSPGDRIMGLSLNSGGHLTHGHRVNISGKWFDSCSYTISEDGLIDMDEVRKIALNNKPKLIIAGASCYSREIDFASFKDIANEVGAYLLADIAHYSGLIAANQYPSPLPYADVVTSTTHKTLRGPRGGIILTNDKSLYEKIQAAVFPGTQGGPLMHIIAAKAVAFKEALGEDFVHYIKEVKHNARIVASVLIKEGIDIVSGGTDSHLVLVDLRKKGVTGKEVADSLERSGITCNKNAVPNDPKGPMITSGLRLGSPSCVTRGMGEKEFTKIACWISEIIDCISAGLDPKELETNIKKEVIKLAGKFSSPFSG